MAEPTTMIYVDAIKSRLTELAANITASGRLNQTDIHVISENFYAELLNIAYGWNLKNANVDHPNAEGIDLVDDNEKILVQVSATCSKRKIDHSLKEIDEAYRGYHFYFLPLIAVPAKSQKMRTYFPPHDVIFNPQNDIIEIVDLIQALQADTTGERLKKADQYIKDNLRRSIEEGSLPTDYAALKVHLSKILKDTRERHPSFRLMKIDDGLFPQGVPELHNIEAVNDSNEIKTVPAIVAESWGRKEKNHLMIEGEGGIGKTVTLLSLPDKFVPHEVPAVYVQLHRLKVERGDKINTAVTVETIENYIKDVVFFGNNEQFRQFDELTRIPWNGGPQVLLLLDGFNEIVPEGRWPIGEDINRWAERPGIQIITSSRFDIHSYVPLGSGYNQIHLQPLSRSVIKDYLNGLGIPQPRTKSQWNIITYPLMLFLYAQTKDAMSAMDRDLRIQNYKASNSAGAIIWNYLQRELWRYRQENTDVVNCVLATEYIAPFIAWKMQKDSVFSLDEDRFEDYLDEAYDRISGLAVKQFPPHIRRVLRHMHCGFPTCYDIQSFIEEEQLRLFIRNETTYTLVHQQFRDALAAMHLINASYASDCLPEEWKTPVDYYVMQFVDDLIGQEEAENLWERNRKSESHSDAATINMLELQKRKREYDFSELNFSGLDFRNISLYPYRIPGTSILRLPHSGLLNDKLLLSENTFYPEETGKYIRTLAITPDGRRFVTGTADNCLRVWDLDSGHCLKTLKGHSSTIKVVSVTPDGKRCISGSLCDEILRVWDLDSGECLRELEGYEDYIRVIVITPDGKRCISSGSIDTLCVWDLDSGDRLKTLDGHGNHIYSFAITPDGNRCISGSKNNKMLRVWDLESGECLKELEGHEGSVRAIVVTPDGKGCISGSDDKTLRLWDLKSGQCIKVFHGHSDLIRALAITPDGKRIVSSSEDDTLRIWDIESGQCLKILSGHDDLITTFVISPDGRRCVSGSKDRTLRVWDMESGSCQWIHYGFNGLISTLAVVPDGRQCVSGADPSTICIWDLESGRCLRTLEDYDDSIHVLSVTPDGRYSISGSSDKTLSVWDLKSGRCIKTLEEHDGSISSLVITSDGKYCVGGSLEKNHNSMENYLAVSFWDLESWHYKKALRINNRLSEAFAISPGGEYCVIGSLEKSQSYVPLLSFTFWDLNSGQCINTFEEYNSSIDILAVTPDGKRCISESDEKLLRVCDSESNEVLFFLAHEIVTALAISHDGKRCVGGLLDSTLRIWDLESFNCLKSFHVEGGSIRAIAITPNGKKCVSVSNSTLHVWDLETWQCLRVLNGYMDSDITALAITADGKKCVAGSKGGSLFEWDLDSYQVKKIQHLPLFLPGADLSLSIISSPDLKTTLWQNGAIV